MARRTKDDGAALADTLMGRAAVTSTGPMLVIPPPVETGTRVPVLEPRVEKDSDLVEARAPSVETFVASPATRPDPPPLFVSANRGDGIHPDIQRIVQTIYAPDAFQQYADLEQNLEVGDQRGDYRTLTVHLDKAEARSRRAHKLYLGAKLELATWEIDSRRVAGAMRGEAHAELEAEKEAGERRKMITDADIESRIAEKFPDEWRSQQLTRVKLKGVVDDMEHLTRRWDMKCGDLRTLLETLRK